MTAASLPSARLWMLLVPTLLYLEWAYYLRPFNHVSLVDGGLGVLLGLYTCSHPAANCIDLIFLERGAFRRATSEWTGVGWLALNFVVMLVGWMVLVVGTTQFTGRASFDV
jgi:hypothetical protein